MVITALCPVVILKVGTFTDKWTPVEVNIDVTAAKEVDIFLREIPVRKLTSQLHPILLKQFILKFFCFKLVLLSLKGGTIMIIFVLMTVMACFKGVDVVIITVSINDEELVRVPV